MKYEIFISYSRKDSVVAEEVCRAFDRAGITYFIDRQENPDDLEIPATLADAIIGSRIFLLLASENSYSSKFVNAEITFAFNKLPRRCIVPYIIDGSEMPMSMRFIFSTINWRDRRTHPVEPRLVADLCGILGRVVPTVRKSIDVDNIEYYEIGRGHERGITALAITRASDVIASASADGTVCLWDMFMGERKGEAFSMDGDEVQSVSLSPDGRLLAASGWADTCLWDTDTHELLHRFSGNNAVFSPDGQKLAVVEEEALKIYSTEDFGVINNMKSPVTEPYDTVCAVAFSPDNASLAVGDAKGHVWIMGCETGGEPISRRCLDLEKSCRIASLAMTPDGKRLLAASSMGITCWCLSDGESDLFPSNDVVESVSVSPDGLHFATADYAGALKIYDITEEKNLFERRLVNVNRVLYSPDGEFIVSGDCFGSVAVWNLKPV